MVSKLVGICGLVLVLGGCGGGDRAAVAATPPAAAKQTDWRIVATDNDRDRLRRWRDAWMTALPAARARDAAAIDAQGALFQPDRALSDPTPPPGRYRCRVFKLGSTRPGAPAFVAHPVVDCRVAQEGELLSLFKETGAQRPVGLLFPDSPSRMIFLGTLSLGDEQRALDYGQDNDRDMAGVFERIGERRWRLALPWPRFDSQLDVVELTPSD